jgi:hypothetical protein
MFIIINFNYDIDKPRDLNLAQAHLNQLNSQ